MSNSGNFMKDELTSNADTVSTSVTSVGNTPKKRRGRRRKRNSSSKLANKTQTNAINGNSGSNMKNIINNNNNNNNNNNSNSINDNNGHLLSNVHTNGNGRMKPPMKSGNKISDDMVIEYDVKSENIEITNHDVNTKHNDSTQNNGYSRYLSNDHTSYNNGNNTNGNHINGHHTNDTNGYVRYLNGSSTTNNNTNNGNGYSRYLNGTKSNNNNNNNNDNNNSNNNITNNSTNNSNEMKTDNGLSPKEEAIKYLKDKWDDDIDNNALNENEFLYPKCYIQVQGIKNRNVDCYISAILQCLLSLPMFTSIIYYLSEYHARNIGDVTYTIHKIISLFVLKHKRQYIYLPSEIKNIVNQFHKYTGKMGHEQQDGHEFLHFLLENLHNELTWYKRSNKRGKKRKNGMKNNKNKQTKTNKNDMDNGWKKVGGSNNKTKKGNKVSVSHVAIENNESLISILFGGTIYQKLIHVNKQPSVGYQSFFTFDLDINIKKIKNINQTIQYTMEKKIVEIGKSKNADKCIYFSKLPNYLILNLKRFIYDYSKDSNGNFKINFNKLYKHISFSKKLKIPKRFLYNIKNIKNKTGNVNYELKSILVHIGDHITHGHYISYCKRKINNKVEWFEFDDDKVSKVDFDFVRNQQAYVLFFKKIV